MSGTSQTGGGSSPRAGQAPVGPEPAPERSTFGTSGHGPGGRSERRLFSAFLFTGLGALALGGSAAAGVAFARAPALPFPDEPRFYYQLLTVHGLTSFYHWLLFFQGALLILAVGLYVPGARAWSLQMGWAAYGVMALGAALQFVAAISGGEVLYTALPPLTGQFPRSPLIYLGFALLALGVLLLAVDYVLTVARARQAGQVKELPTPTYVGILWSIVMIAAGVIALGIYTPAFLWSVGAASIDPMAYQMGYFTFFHVNHYVPLLAAVGLWYVLAKASTGAHSVLGERFSKAIFTIYPIVVPPTFLYHLFLAPGVPSELKVAGSVLSLLIGVPTLIVGIVVVGLLEARMRSLGAHGPAGWLRALPWREPAFGGLVMSMLTFGVGGAFTYSLLSEALAGLHHGTFIVPGYFHAFTSAGVTLAFMAATYLVLPGIFGRPLWGLAVARIQPYVMAAGTIIFVAFGVAAGYAGVPRRVADITYGGAAPASWAPLMNATEAVGGVLMVIAGALFFVVVLGTVLSGERKAQPQAQHASLPSRPAVAVARMTWAAVLPAVLVAAAIVAVSLYGFELIASLAFEVK